MILLYYFCTNVIAGSMRWRKQGLLLWYWIWLVSPSSGSFQCFTGVMGEDNYKDIASWNFFGGRWNCPTPRLWWWLHKSKRVIKLVKLYTSRKTANFYCVSLKNKIFTECFKYLICMVLRRLHKSCSQCIYNLIKPHSDHHIKYKVKSIRREWFLEEMAYRGESFIEIMAHQTALLH